MYFKDFFRKIVLKLKFHINNLFFGVVTVSSRSSSENLNRQMNISPLTIGSRAQLFY